MRHRLIILGFLLLYFAGCRGGEPAEIERVEVEATREVTVEVPATVIVPVTVVVERQTEVTRIVEVTRVTERAVTVTPLPTPQATGTPEETIDDVRTDLSAALISSLEELDDVERVNVARIGDGVIYVELNTLWASQGNQPDVSWTIVTLMADALKDLSADDRAALIGAENFIFHLVTFSTDNDYRYQSETDFESLLKIANRQMTIGEWEAASNAGFR